jgi:hypothetical protein
MPQNESSSEQRGDHAPQIEEECISVCKRLRDSALKEWFKDEAVDKDIFRRIKKENAKTSDDFVRIRFRVEIRKWTAGDASKDQYSEGVLEKVRQEKVRHCNEGHKGAPTIKDLVAHWIYRVRTWPEDNISTEESVSTKDNVAAKEELSQADLAHFLVSKMNIMCDPARTPKIAIEAKYMKKLVDDSDLDDSDLDGSD